MKSQDKAKKLVDKYLNLSVNVIHTDCEGDISIASGTPTQSHAKQCAIIAVDEILLHESQAHSVLDLSTEYWREVKTEIEKI